MRAELGATLRRPGLRVVAEQVEEGGGDSRKARLVWWTFAGGRINQALRHGVMLHAGEWKVTSENRLLPIEGEGATVGRLEKIVRRLAEAGTWTEPSFRGRLLESLPDFRLSKFQRALPEDHALEMIRDALLDIDGAVELCRGAAASA